MFELAVLFMEGYTVLGKTLEKRFRRLQPSTAIHPFLKIKNIFQLNQNQIYKPSTTLSAQDTLTTSQRKYHK